MKAWLLIAALALVAQGDPRVKAVDDIEKMGDQGDADDACRAFAAKNAAPNGALLTMASSGAFVVLAGGLGQPNGVCVSVAGAPKGKAVLIAGDGAAGGKGGRSAWGQKQGPVSTSGASGKDHRPSGGGAGRGGGFGASVAGVAVRGQSGDTGEGGPAGEDSDLPSGEELKALDEAVDALAAELDQGSDADRKKKIEEFAAKHRPSRGAVAAWSEDGTLFVLVAANGSASDPNGISVEVAGAPAARIVAIAGDKHGKGKPGKAKAPKGALTRDGR